MKVIIKKSKEKIKKFLNSNKFLEKPYRKFSALKYQILVEKKFSINKPEMHKTQVELTKEALKLIEETNKDYIVLYNPEWLGVANSTKGLFDSTIPVKTLLKKKSRKQLIDKIIEKKLKTVILSQIVDGWLDLIKELKIEYPTIDIKVIWHANSFETISDYTWGFNKKVIEYVDNGYISTLAFVKKTMAELYRKKGYKTHHFLNNVKSFDHLKNEIEMASKNIEDITDFENRKIKVGIYNMHSRELKNVYTQILATTLFKDSIVDIVPASKDIIKYVEELGINYTKVDEFIPTDKLMKRLLANDINIYATFTECSPMLPIESFEMGVPCLIGNNNDYFEGSKLREYVTIKAEDNPEEIYKQMKICLENKKEVMKLYKEWKESFNKEIKVKIKEYIED